MQVLTKDLLPNPYRRMEKYHLQPERLNALVRSIRDTSFWDNILARPNPDGSETYQIAYGHHRLEAVKTCNIKQVNIPVKDLCDALMVKIMANENQSDWHMDTAVMNQTIWAVQDFIRDAVKSGDILTGLSKNAITYIQKNNEVGHKILQEFLGKSWETRIRTALELRKLEDETSDKYDPELLEATEEIKTPSVAKEFAKAAKDYNIPKSQYKPLAREIQQKKKSAKETFKTVRQARPKTKPMPGRDKLLSEIEDMVGEIDDNARALYSSIWRANQKLKALEVDEIGGLQAAFTVETFSKLLRMVREYLIFFGFDHKAVLIGGANNGK